MLTRILLGPAGRGTGRTVPRLPTPARACSMREPHPMVRRPVMRHLVASLTALALFALAFTAHAQDGKAGLEAVAKALGEPGLKSIEYNASGTIFQFGQSQAPGQAW